MLEDVIERFRYRFQLWRREHREDSMWGGTWPEFSPQSHVEAPESSWRSVAPKDRVVLTVSTPRFVLRMLVPYLAVLVILVAGFHLLGTFVPFLHFVSRIASIVLATLWTLTIGLGSMRICAQRKQYRLWRQHLTNQSS
jgi:hypothetical protein